MLLVQASAQPHLSLRSPLNTVSQRLGQTSDTGSVLVTSAYSLVVSLRWSSSHWPWVAICSQCASHTYGAFQIRADKIGSSLGSHCTVLTPGPGIQRISCSMDVHGGSSHSTAVWRAGSFLSNSRPNIYPRKDAAFTVTGTGIIHSPAGMSETCSCLRLLTGKDSSF